MLPCLPRSDELAGMDPIYDPQAQQQQQQQQQQQPSPEQEMLQFGTQGLPIGMTGVDQQVPMVTPGGSSQAELLQAESWGRDRDEGQPTATHTASPGVHARGKSQEKDADWVNAPYDEWQCRVM